MRALLARTKLEKEYGLKESDKILLSVGELNGNKNHKVIVKALGMLNKGERSRFHYFIAGKGGLRRKLLELADGLGVQLHILGFRKDVPDLMRAADVFILPSIREGLNVGLIEAMASGLPCIASYIRGNKDLMDIAGCYMVVYDNLDGWSYAVRKVCFCTKMRYMEDAKAEVINGFSIGAVNQKLKRVYDVS